MQNRTCKKELEILKMKKRIMMKIKKKKKSNQIKSNQIKSNNKKYNK